MQRQKTAELIIALAIVPFLSNPALALPTASPPAHKPSTPTPATQQHQTETLDQLHQKLDQLHQKLVQEQAEQKQEQQLKHNNTATNSAQESSSQPKAPQQSQPSSKPQTASSQQKETSSFKNGKVVLTKTPNKNGYHNGEPVVIVVDKSSHYTYVMALENGDKVVEVLRASNAIGTADTPTPYGPYKVTSKQKYPTWYPPKDIKKNGKPVPPYNKTHKNPLGVAEIKLNKFGIFMHGTNDPHSLRHSVSHGCIRHSNGDIMKIYGMVHPGTTVLIVQHFAGTVLTKAEFEGEKDTLLSKEEKEKSTGSHNEKSSSKAAEKHSDKHR